MTDNTAPAATDGSGTGQPPSLVLLDHKGGHTFAGFDRLPHVVANISNLDDAPTTLSDRLVETLDGEIRRREALLAHDNVDGNADDHRRAAKPD